VLLVDAQGYDIISAKIASTVHDTLQAFIRHRRTTLDMFERINLRMAESVTPRNALGCDKDENWRENATMLYGEICPNGPFPFRRLRPSPSARILRGVREIYGYMHLGGHLKTGHMWSLQNRP
jgi:hypothetical protein